jgi:tetratricopeptide (TPR) repeat protein
MVSTLFVISGFAQEEKKRIRNGNSEYEEGNYQDAEKEYRKALMEKPGYVKGTFNLGDAMYEQENYEESTNLFTEVVERSSESDQKSAAYYNLGNTFMKEKKYKESIDAYKNSLRLNPTDANSKYNLEYARKKLNEQQEQEQQNQDQDKEDKEDNKDKKDKDKKNDKKNQDKKDQEKEKKDQDNKDQNKGEDKKDQQKEEPQQISKQDAQRMLDALQNDEKKTLQELQKQKAKAAKGKKSDIDW